MIFVDSNIFVIDLRYPRDANTRVNRDFLDWVGTGEPCVTGRINLLEICGVLSFNLSHLQLRELYHHFARRYRIGLVPAASESALSKGECTDLLELIGRKMSLGDAIVAWTMERYCPGTSAFISWNARHFNRKLRCPALTPAEFLHTAVR